MEKKKPRRPNFRTCCLGLLPALCAGCLFLWLAMLSSGLITPEVWEALSQPTIVYISRAIAVACGAGALMGGLVAIVRNKELHEADFPWAIAMAVLLGVGLLLVNESGDLLLLMSGTTSLIWAVILFGLKHIYAEGERHSNPPRVSVPPASPFAGD